MNFHGMNPNVTKYSEKKRESQEKNAFTEVRGVIQLVEV